MGTSRARDSAGPADRSRGTGAGRRRPRGRAGRARATAHQLRPPDRRSWRTARIRKRPSRCAFVPMLPLGHDEIVTKKALTVLLNRFTRGLGHVGCPPVCQVGHSHPAAAGLRSPRSSTGCIDSPTTTTGCGTPGCASCSGASTPSRGCAIATPCRSCRAARLDGVLDDIDLMVEYRTLLDEFDRYMENGSGHWFDRDHGDASTTRSPISAPSTASTSRWASTRVASACSPAII